MSPTDALPLSALYPINTLSILYGNIPSTQQADPHSTGRLDPLRLPFMHVVPPCVKRGLQNSKIAIPRNKREK